MSLFNLSAKAMPGFTNTQDSKAIPCRGNAGYHQTRVAVQWQRVALVKQRMQVPLELQWCRCLDKPILCQTPIKLQNERSSCTTPKFACLCTFTSVCF